MSGNSYKAKVKALRNYLPYTYDLRKNLDEYLTPKQKAEITRAYNALKPVITQKHVVFRPKSQKGVEAAQKVTGLKLKLKAYPIESPTGSGRVKLSAKGDLIIEKDGASARTIRLDQLALITNTRAYLSEIVEPGKTYIANSTNDWRAAGVGSSIIDIIEAALERYDWAAQAEDLLDEGYDEQEILELLGEDGGKRHFRIDLIEVDFKAGSKRFNKWRAERVDEQRERNAKYRKERQAARKRAYRAKRSEERKAVDRARDTERKQKQRAAAKIAKKPKKRR